MSQETRIKLEQALYRLLQGVPKYTKPDGKISLSRINSEARLSSGAIYYDKYKDFVDEAKDKIIDYEKKKKEIKDKEKKSEELSELEVFKIKLEQAINLKNKYRHERDEQKVINDGLLEQNCALSLRVFELSSEIKSITSGRVTALTRKK